MQITRNSAPRALGPPRRGYRRVEWIERALAAPAGRAAVGSLPSGSCPRSRLIGWESMIVLEDIRALSPVEAEEVCVWTSRTLLLATERELTHGVE
jgi:hypothetical protein